MYSSDVHVLGNRMPQCRGWIICEEPSKLTLTLPYPFPTHVFALCCPTEHGISEWLCTVFLVTIDRSWLKLCMYGCSLIETCRFQPWFISTASFPGSPIVHTYVPWPHGNWFCAHIRLSFNHNRSEESVLLLLCGQSHIYMCPEGIASWEWDCIGTFLYVWS